AKDLLSNNINSLKDITHSILKIKLNSKYHQVLEQMKSHQIHIALVEDEQQSPLGIITMENILENIVGDIKDEYDQS
ncbi:CBS domain-containing protein, partial [Staphylococcus xylosus]